MDIRITLATQLSLPEAAPSREYHDFPLNIEVMVIAQRIHDDMRRDHGRKYRLRYEESQ
ncbi:hypothetical protein NXV05_21295 [Parabacteroides johnsonii]|nr:hypothetical protein [Parabacteroides johnsonii]